MMNNELILDNEMMGFVDDIADRFVSVMSNYGMGGFYDLSYEAAEKFEHEFHGIVARKYGVITSLQYAAIAEQYPTTPMLKVLKGYGITDPNHELIPMIETLKNRKVTMYYLNDFGLPVFEHTVIQFAYLAQYAQYEGVLYLQHRPKRKRQDRTRISLPHQDLVIYDGWISLDVERLTMNVTQSKDFTVKQGKYLSFDKRYITDVTEQTDHTPLLMKRGIYR